MTITLSGDHEQLVQELLASGQYPSPSDVIAAALGLLEANPEAHAKLRAMIAEGDAAIAQGKVGPLDAVETLARVRARRGAEFAPGLRSFVIDRCVFFYRLTDDGITISRIIHGSQDADAIMRDE